MSKSKTFHKPKTHNNIKFVTISDTPIENRILFSQAPKDYFSDTDYLQTFIFELFDGTQLLTEVILSDSEKEHDLIDECMFLGHAAVIHYNKDGSMKLLPYHTDIEYFDQIDRYGEPLIGIHKQYINFKATYALVA